MSFLDKFKGRTNHLSHQQVNTLLPPHHSPQQNLHHGIPNSTIQNISRTTAPEHNSKNKNHKQSQEQKKQNKVSPFYVLNPFYLDELERERDERAKKQQEIKQRLERERKKRMELQAKLAQSNKANKEKYVSKEWVQLGGLGPNIGTEEWVKKNEMHNKMLSFAKQIKKMNFEKIKVVPFVSLSHLHQNDKQNPRTRAIEYSHSVPRPRVVGGQQVLQRLPKSESKQELSELQRLNMNHLKYVQMMKKL